jgi:hypothetical protein
MVHLQLARLITGPPSSAQLADDAPNICKLALPTTHPPSSSFHAQWARPFKLFCVTIDNATVVNAVKVSSHALNVNNYYKIVVISEIFLIILEIQNRKLGRQIIIKSMTR